MAVMPAPKKVTNEEILEALRKRDRRQRPAVTPSHVANGFDVHTRTIKRRLDELVGDGEVSCLKYANVTVYWSNAVASCAECGADCEDLDGYDIRCYQCGSYFVQTATPEGPTEEAKSVRRNGGVAVWWGTLPKTIKILAVKLAAYTAPLRSEGISQYRPDMVRYDRKKDEIYIQKDDPEAESDVEDTDEEDDERRLVIGVKGDGLGISKE
jgi:hypothetical protein